MDHKHGDNPSKREKLSSEIRTELRSIIRQLADLSQPISRFDPLLDPTVGQPGYWAHFDDRPHRRISGLRLHIMKALALPDERISDTVLSAAKAIWHLKDRLRRWCELTAIRQDTEEHAKQCPHLLICADLANWKKHGQHTNRSKCSPRIDLVYFDVSHSGIIELFYEGVTKDKELLVSNPTPIPFRIPVLAGNTKSEIGDATAILAAAF